MKLDKYTEKNINSFKHAFDGIISALKTERNMRIHIFIMYLVTIAGILLKISVLEWIICLLLFGAVISSELINTSIEKLVDMVMPYKHEKAKLVKDIAAGAVLVWAIVAAIIGLIIFVPKITVYF